jgi:hypothetical protein
VTYRFCSVVITGMDEDDIKHIRDSTIITEFNLNDEGEVKDFVVEGSKCRRYSDRLCMKV